MPHLLAKNGRVILFVGCLFSLYQSLILLAGSHYNRVDSFLPPLLSLLLLSSSSSSSTNDALHLALILQEQLDHLPECQHGGLRLKNGSCICGRGTQGLRCETVLPQVAAQVDSYGFCGPGCWAAYVWYPTEDFRFRPLSEQGDSGADAEERQSYLKEQLLDFLIWQQGGEVRAPSTPPLIRHGQQPSNGDDLSGNNNHGTAAQEMEMWTSLGPWTAADKKMFSAFHEFRRAEEKRQQHDEGKDNLKDENNDKDNDLGIVFGLFLHDNVPRFQALWEVLFDEKHYFMIHIDAHNDETAERGREEDMGDSSASSSSSSSSSRRQEIIDIIAATPLSNTSSIWERVFVVEEESSFHTFWGDVTLVYSEVLLWLRLFQVAQERRWNWSYFINLSGSDIPVVGHQSMVDFLMPYVGGGSSSDSADGADGADGGAAATSFLYYHENAEEFRQTYILPEKRAHEEVVAFELRQNETNFGNYRNHVINISRMYGCSQWHVLHKTLVRKLVTVPEIEGLLFSMRFTSIPDESFFGTAAVWLRKQFPEEITLEARDLRYWNEGVNRNLAAKGELRTLVEETKNGQILLARKSETALVTCVYTNKLLALENNCTIFEGTGPYPSDALFDDPPERPPDAKEWE